MWYTLTVQKIRKIDHNHKKIYSIVIYTYTKKYGPLIYLLVHVSQGNGWG